MAAGTDTRAGHRTARTVSPRSRDLSPQIPPPAVGRRAPARRRGEGARGRSRGAADGRAVRRGRPDHPRRAASRARPYPPGDRENNRVRDPRHRRSAAASTACSRGTKYSDCNSLPALGVKPMRKCGRRSYHGPGTPICSVQFSAESSAIGWRFLVARFAPKNSGVASKAWPCSSVHRISAAPNARPARLWARHGEPGIVRKAGRPRWHIAGPAL